MLTFSPSQLISESLLFGILEWFIFLFLRKSAVLWSHCLKERKKKLQYQHRAKEKHLENTLHHLLCSPEYTDMCTCVQTQPQNFGWYQIADYSEYNLPVNCVHTEYFWGHSHWSSFKFFPIFRGWSNQKLLQSKDYISVFFS